MAWGSRCSGRREPWEPGPQRERRPVGRKRLQAVRAMLALVEPDFDGKWASCKRVYFSSQERRQRRGNVEVACPSHRIAVMTTPHARPVRSQRSSPSGNNYCKTPSHLNLVIGALPQDVAVFSRSETSRGNNRFQKGKVRFHNFYFLFYFEIIASIVQLPNILYPDSPILTCCHICTLIGIYLCVHLYIYTYICHFIVTVFDEPQVAESGSFMCFSWYFLGSRACC